jgi:hypothetical protein
VIAVTSFSISEDDRLVARVQPMQAIMAATGCSADAVRDFLDSRHGRHFADDVGNGVFEGLA